MTAQAKLSYLKISPKKVRLVADVIRGMAVNEAEQQLSFINRSAAKPLLRLLRSAVANAESNKKLKKDHLIIKELVVNEGPTAYRWMPKAYGRASPIRRRTSHILIILEEKESKAEKIKKDRPEDKDDFKNQGLAGDFSIKDEIPKHPVDNVKLVQKKKKINKDETAEKKNIFRRVFKGRAKDKKDQ